MFFLLSRLTRWFVALHSANIRRMCEIYVRNRQLFILAMAKSIASYVKKQGRRTKSCVVACLVCCFMS